MLVNALLENWISPLLALLLAVVIRVFAPTALVAASPFLLAWLLAPWLMVWLAQSAFPPQRAISARQRRQLRLIARRTWLYFEQFVGPDDHWLAPDNYQEEPRAVVVRSAEHTSELPSPMRLSD